MIKRLLSFFFIVAFVAVSPVFAQNQQKRGGKQSRFKELIEFKVKFLAQEMELKADQQKQFVTLYTQMSNEIHEAMHEADKMRRRVEKDKTASDADYQKASKAMTDAQAKVTLIEKRYNDKFKTFLSEKQIFKMKDAEEKFRAKLYEMRQEKKKNK